MLNKQKLKTTEPLGDNMMFINNIHGFCPLAESTNNRESRSWRILSSRVTKTLRMVKMWLKPTHSVLFSVQTH